MADPVPPEPPPLDRLIEALGHVLEVMQDLGVRPCHSRKSGGSLDDDAYYPTWIARYSNPTTCQPVLRNPSFSGGKERALRQGVLSAEDVL